MGQCSQCSNVERLSSINGAMIMINLERAIATAQHTITESDKSQIDYLLKRGLREIVEVGSYLLILDIHPQSAQTIKSITKQSRSQCLVVGLYIDPLHHNTAVKTQQISGRGIVAYTNGFYVGELMNNYAEGSGTFYFTTDILQKMKLRVIGRWSKGQLKSGQFFRNQGQKIVNLNFLASGNNAKIQIYQKGSINPTIYQGSIKNIKQQKLISLQSMMTGVGRIYFPNGDVYQGGVLNGLMHSSSGVESRYTSNSSNGAVAYIGGFRDGVRQGKGIIQVNLACSFVGEVDETNTYQIQVEYHAGKIVEGRGLLKGFNAGDQWVVDVIEGEDDGLKFEIKNQVYLEMN